MESHLRRSMGEADKMRVKDCRVFFYCYCGITTSDAPGSIQSWD